MNCFTRSIQGPGCGTKRSQAGWALRAGDKAQLMPAAIATNIRRMIAGDCAKANPSAVPR